MDCVRRVAWPSMVGQVTPRCGAVVRGVTAERDARWTRVAPSAGLIVVPTHDRGGACGHCPSPGSDLDRAGCSRPGAGGRQRAGRTAGASRRPVHRARQCAPGLRRRAARRGERHPARRPGPGGAHQAGQLPGRVALPGRGPGQRLPGARGRHRGDVRPGDRAQRGRGAVGPQRLRPVHPDRGLHLPDHPRRHQARPHRAPADAPGRDRQLPRRVPGAGHHRPDAAVPDPDRVLRLRLRRPLRSHQRHRRDRQRDGLRRGRREHARHRLLRRRLRLLRAPAEPRRLRRHRDHRPSALGQGPPGRHDGHLLRRHQPALHRPAATAAPRRDLAAVGPRRHRDHAVPRWRPEHRLRRGLGQGAPERGAGCRHRRQGHPGVRREAGGERGPDLQGQPGAAPRGRRPDGQDPGQQPLQPAGGRPAGPGHLRAQDQRPHVPGLPVAGRTDRRSLPDPGLALHRHEQEVVHLHQRRARRLARPRDAEPVVRLPRALRRPPVARWSTRPSCARRRR